MLLGEAGSKCEHVAGVPLMPKMAQDLMKVYLAKGAHGTTSIEGNTLTEEEVLKRVNHDLPLSKSREYLGSEIDNMVHLFNQIGDDVFQADPPPLTTDRILTFHRDLFEDLPHNDDVQPGEIREHSVGVGTYRGAPAEDCRYLLDRLCEWLNNGFIPGEGQEDLRFVHNVLKATMAHLYIAWIHPFGDGNGRVARLVEFEMLIRAGVPFPAAHLLSNHYNRTRTAYYATLERTSRQQGYPVESFVEYAAQGLVDELREQLDVVREHQMSVMWQTFVHTVYHDDSTAAKRRQKHIALDLPKEWTKTTDIRSISTRVAGEYGGKTTKTVTRDLNALAASGLVERRGNRVRPVQHLVRAFLPPRREQ